MLTLKINKSVGMGLFRLRRATKIKPGHIELQFVSLQTSGKPVIKSVLELINPKGANKRFCLQLRIELGFEAKLVIRGATIIVQIIFR